jgi:tRNA 2-selenouridine synthase SelU
MEPGDSIKVTECRLSRRPSIYSSVKQVIEDAHAERKIRGEYKTATHALGADKFEVRVYRVR